MQNAGRKKGGEVAEFKEGSLEEVMKHRDVWVDPGNDELASPAFQPPFHKAFPQFHSSLFLVCSPFKFS